mgnify:FL=1
MLYKFKGRIVASSLVLLLLIFIRTAVWMKIGRVPHLIPIPGIIALIIAWLLGRKYDETFFLSMKDPLTGLNNRRYVHFIFPKFIKTAQRKKKKLVVFVYDVDEFKQINDHYGHEYGDQILLSVSKVLESDITKHDVIARWGGDEFLGLSLFSDLHEIKARIDSLQSKLKELAKSFEKKISVSVGYSVYGEDGKRLHDLIEKADQNMYRNKHSRKTV